MPSIADSTMTVDTPVLDPTASAGQVVVGSASYMPPLRSTLPANEVLDTVTARAGAQIGALPVWKISPVASTTASSTSNSSSSSSLPPKSPTVIQSSFEATSSGYSFMFYVENDGSDTIAGYNVYRNTENSFSGATQILFIPQPFTNSTTLQVSDPVPQSSTVTNYYWISSVNSDGLESPPTGVGGAAGAGGSTGVAPQQVTSVSAVESPYKTADGQMLSLVSVDFTPALNDPNFNSVNIYFTGYNGNQLPQLMSNSSESPAEFLCETTHETVTVTVVAVSADGIEATWASAPVAYVALDGVVSPPPYPSISQAQTALDGNTGWQFSFNIIGGLEFDQIQCYRIYHSESNVTPVPPNNYFRTIPQPNTNVGEEVVQEITGDILFYWISAVNTSGLESALTPVPFTYIDPGAPPPNINPVETTKNYVPTVSLNGWGKSAHVGFWETQDSDNNTNFGYSSSQTVNPFNNPGAAYDGNQSTAATFSQTHHAEYAGCVWSFNNFPGLASGASIQSATLSIVSDVLQTAGPVHGEGSIWYSTDGGNNWTEVYLASYQNGGYALRPKQTDTVTLSTSINPALLQVMACAHSHDDLAMDVYEISLSLTISSNTGPEKVTGVTAALVNNDVQITWNGLVPLSRTDITEYRVYRALHGAGYVNSHLQATITPTGAATYSWSDPEAHDGSWDYWVIALNSTGYSPASDVVFLHTSTSVLYLNGTTLESLKPAQAGADVTSQNTSHDTSNVDGVPAATVAANASSGSTGVAQLNSVDYLTNADKLQLIQEYNAELSIKSSLDSTASSLNVSSTSYDNAVTAIGTTLTNAGAPSNWSSIWPDGTTFGPVVGIQTMLANNWATVAQQRTALQNAISATQAAQQAAAAQSAAVSAAATDATNKMNTAISDAQTYANNAQAAAISSAANTAMQKVDWTTGGDFNGALIANGTILADSLILANYDNLIPNPNSEQSAPPGGWPSGAFEASALYNLSGYGQCRMTQGAQYFLTPLIPVKAGDQFFFQADANPDMANTGAICLEAVNSSGTGFQWPEARPQAAGAWQTISFTYTVPAGCVFIHAYIIGYDIPSGDHAYFNNFYLRRMADANLIVDGSITGNKLDVASVQTTILTAGVIQSDNIAAGAITVDKLTVTGNANQCTNPNFDSGSLTGWDTSEAPSYVATFATSGLAVPGPHPYAMRLIAGDSSTFAVRNLNHVAVTEGQAYIASASFYVNGPLTSGGYAYVRLRGLDASNNETILATGSPQPLLPSKKWVQGNAQATIPAGIVTVNLEIVYAPPVTGADIFVNGCNLQIATAGALIVDGSIQASQIAAGAITGDMITAGELIANVIYFNDGGNLQALQPAEAGADATLGHIDTRKVVTNANQGNFTTSPVEISNPTMGFNVLVNSTSDVINLWVNITGYGSSTSGTVVQIMSVVDGNTASPVDSSTYQLNSGDQANFVFLSSISGLTAGVLHTVAVYVELPGGGSFEVYSGSTCICQHIH